MVHKVMLYWPGVTLSYCCNTRKYLAAYLTNNMWHLPIPGLDKGHLWRMPLKIRHVFQKYALI